MSQPTTRPSNIPVPTKPDNLLPEERAEVTRRIHEIAAEADERVNWNQAFRPSRSQQQTGK